jgi:hypothetical protein
MGRVNGQQLPRTKKGDLFYQTTKLPKELTISWAPVAHVCNPNYSGGRDQEDWGSKPALGN